METAGAYDYAYDMDVVHEDGSRETRTVTIDVTGDPENWTVTQDNGDGEAYETVSGDSGAAGDSVTVTDRQDGDRGLAGCRRGSTDLETAQDVTPAGVIRQKNADRELPCPRFSVLC